MTSIFNSWIGRLATGACITLATLATTAAAGEAPLELTGPGPYYTVEIAPPLQSEAANPDLSDLQIVNGKGEALPFAWAVKRVPKAVERRQDIALFKMPDRPSELGASGPSGSSGWMLDTHQVQGTLLTLHLSLPPNEQGIYQFTLATSADLKHWQTTRKSAQLFSFPDQGLRRDSTSIDLGGITVRYLGLLARPHIAELPLMSAQITSVTPHFHSQPLRWSESLAPTNCTPQSCDYKLPRHSFPEQIDVRAMLTKDNTLAPLQVTGLREPTAAPVDRHPHGLRQHVKDLRKKTAPQPSDAPPVWESLSQSTLFLLKLPEGIVHSEHISVQGGHYVQLRLKTSGTTELFEPPPPPIRVASRSRTLVFLARDPAPYRVTWGASTSPSTALKLNQLIPKHRSSDPLPQSTARVVMPNLEAAAALPQMASAASAASATPAAHPISQTQPHKVWLWAALSAGLGLMGWMAFSLLKRGTEAKT